MNLKEGTEGYVESLEEVGEQKYCNNIIIPNNIKIPK